MAKKSSRRAGTIDPAKVTLRIALFNPGPAGGAATLYVFPQLPTSLTDQPSALEGPVIRQVLIGYTIHKQPQHVQSNQQCVMVQTGHGPAYFVVSFLGEQTLGKADWPKASEYQKKAALMVARMAALSELTLDEDVPAVLR